MIKLFKNLKKKDVMLILMSFLLIITQVWLDLKMPDYMSTITRLVQTEGSKMSEILKNREYMLLCAFGSLISAIIVCYLSSSVSTNFSMIVKKIAW